MLGWEQQSTSSASKARHNMLTFEYGDDQGGIIGSTNAAGRNQGHQAGEEE
jgi:hypothetical protein